MLDRNSSVPIYVQLADEIRRQIESKVILPGDMLCSEAEMVKKYGVARLTVREALNILVNEGLLEKKQGKGTFCKKIVGRKKIHILLDVTDYYFIPYYTESICKVLRSNNADFIVCDTRNSNDEICEYLEEIAVNGSDGVIVQASASTKRDDIRLIKIFELLSEKGIPYVLIDYKYDFLDCSYIILDERHSGKIAGEMFVRNNHTRIACVCVKDDYISMMRLDGIKSEIKPECEIYDGEFLADEIKKAIKCGVTGIFCYNDFIAKKVLDILNAEKLSVPDDISIISVDDTIISDIYKLTSVMHPKGTIGEEAAKSLIGCDLPMHSVKKPKLCVRNSVKKL